MQLLCHGKAVAEGGPTSRVKPRAWRGSAALASDDVGPRGVLTAILDHQKRGASDSIVTTSAAPARCEVAAMEVSAGGGALWGAAACLMDGRRRYPAILCLRMGARGGMN